MTAEHTLTYMDQASFLALRALGRQPLLQFVWIYDRHVDVEGLRRFQHNLGHGLLGRRIEPSILPFGRHHWVAAAGPADVDIAPNDRPREQVWEWADDQVRMPIDPQWGPAWRLSVTPLGDRGSAVSLVVSHSVADGLGCSAAIADAATGIRREFGYPHPRARTRRQAFAQDLRTTARSLPDTARALAATARVARSSRPDRSSAAPAVHGIGPGGDHPVVGPTATVWCALDEWDRRADRLGGTSNSLFAAVAARVALVMGRLRDGTHAALSWPVSDRADGDTRANALTAVTIVIDPRPLTTTLAAVRGEMKSALVASPTTTKELLAPLPMVPFTPKTVVRRVDLMMGSAGTPIGCSNFGDLDPAVNRPDGTDAGRLAFRLLEPTVTASELDRRGGYLYAASGRVGHQIFVTVGAWMAGGPNGKEQLREWLRQAMSDLELSGTVE